MSSMGKPDIYSVVKLQACVLLLCKGLVLFDTDVPSLVFTVVCFFLFFFFVSVSTMSSLRTPHIYFFKSGETSSVCVVALQGVGRDTDDPSLFHDCLCCLIVSVSTMSQ